ncbi:MAG TPA: DUF4410 domain-containing protein [Synergistaceae bacterium]|nr:DUF4410 domain-containing protein [Synergistaceae bacterium]
MKKLTVLFAALGILTAAPVLYADETPLPKPDVLNEETVSTSQRLSTYDVLVVKDFSTDGVAYDNIDDEEKPSVDAMRPLIVKNLSMSIEAEMKKRNLFKNVAPTWDGKSKAVILEGEFTEFNGGNRALRFWVGFGAGKTYLAAKGRLVEAGTGKVLATFEDQETGYKGVATMESFEDLFPHQAKSLGEHVGEFIAKLY